MFMEAARAKLVGRVAFAAPILNRIEAFYKVA